MSEKKHYKIEKFEGEFEFSPNGTPMIGVLSVTLKEQTFSSMVKLLQLGSRAKWAEEAAALYPKTFDAPALKRALNELHILRTEEVEAATNADAVVDEGPSEDEEVDDEAAEKLISEPGVLDRYVEDMAEVREVFGDRPQMKAVALGGLSAQLEILPGNIPMGTNTILSGESGRGKNYITDAVADGLPDEWVYRFESASGKSFYYETDHDPGRFEHVWIYPNEAEATDKLVEILRPLLSGGRAAHKTVNKDPDGQNVFREYEIKGPITATIPTTRNKLNTELQTRLLVTELEDFEGRVAAHSLKVSDTLLAEYVAKDHGTKLRVWKAAFRKLVGIRRAILPKRDPRFKFDSDEVSHGSRVWRNFTSFMLTNAFLEQRNRDVATLETGEQAVVVTAEDYRTAYEVFEGACKRSVANISDTHRAILDAVITLQEESDFDDSNTGYSYRRIAEQADLSHTTVRKHKTYLTQSLAFLREVEGGGLRLVADVDASFWAKGEILKGFPRPEEVAKWWEEEDPEDPNDGGGGPSSASETGFQSFQSEKTRHNGDKYHENSGNHQGFHSVSAGNPSPQDKDEEVSTVNSVETSKVSIESGLDKPDSHGGSGVGTMETSSESEEHPPSTEETPRAKKEPQFCKHNASVGARCIFCEEEEQVREYLADPPQSFLVKAKHALEQYPELPERVVNNLTSEVAHEVFSDPRRGKRARPLVKDKLEEMQRSS